MGMNVRYKVFMSFVILVVLIFGFYFFTDWFSKVTGYLGGEDERERLALCLDEKRAEFYGGEYCSDCEKQLTLFGSAIGFLHYVECETNTAGDVVDTRCKNLREIPAWYIDGEIYYGFKTLAELQELSDCL
jgi:hypothetical protein